eukprot:TRINITY_DN72755_c0_g1_i1.p1 TRINITY_DN72755_c0_g1~~TRINITY_DN72755_c0_g1_i1.p1  ORF type:complete len:907 (-),score=156.10 TRINITY_DN72755_c0_g1_i1:175-2895(-)
MSYLDLHLRIRCAETGRTMTTNALGASARLSEVHAMALSQLELPGADSAPRLLLLPGSPARVLHCDLSLGELGLSPGSTLVLRRIPGVETPETGEGAYNETLSKECPNGHTMSKYVLPETAWCDTCGRDLLPGTNCVQCEECDFIECSHACPLTPESCSASGVPLSPEEDKMQAGEAEPVTAVLSEATTVQAMQHDGNQLTEQTTQTCVTTSSAEPEEEPPLPPGPPPDVKRLRAAQAAAERMQRPQEDALSSAGMGTSCSCAEGQEDGHSSSCVSTTCSCGAVQDSPVQRDAEAVEDVSSAGGTKQPDAGKDIQESPAHSDQISVDDLLVKIGNELPSESSGKVYDRLARILGNIAANPDQIKFRKLKKESSALAGSICCSTSALSLLHMAGFHERMGMLLCPMNANIDFIRTLCDKLEAYRPPSSFSPLARAQSSPSSGGVQLFDDIDFGPNKSSLGSEDLARRVKAWRRASELFPVGSLFGETNVVQGQLNSCWFLAALSSVARMGAGLFHLVIEESFVEGRYTFCFHKEELQGDGGWVQVTIDDFLPVDVDGQLVFAKASNPGVLWPCLFEKAYAKLHGSYHALDKGMEVDAFSDLTGQCVSVIDLNQSADNSLWYYVMEMLKAGGALGCSSFAPDAGTDERVFSAGLPCISESEGILHNHTYLVYELEVDGSDEQLVQLARPIASSRLGVPQEALPGPALADKFSLRWCDTTRLFNCLSLLCPLPPNASTLPVQSGAWHMGEDGGIGTAGGCSLHSSWIRNPQWVLEIKRSCTATFIVTQEEPRLQGVSNNFRPIGLYVAPADGAGHAAVALDAGGRATYPAEGEDWNEAAAGATLQRALDDMPARSGLPTGASCFGSNFAASRQASLYSMQLDGPARWVCIPCTYDPGVCASFWLRVILS